MRETEIKLTQYSHGAGCGCKISPSVLDKILEQSTEKKFFQNLIVGNDQRDDAAVIDIGNNIGIVSTTDFFMPIVDDPFNFGKIAAVNAISDIYAMGAEPIMAIAILGWPIDKLSPEVANKVVSGGRAICSELNIPLAGGHSIDSPEPIFGLAVTGKIHLDNLKKNGGAEVGAKLYLTKGLGVGILTTAEKKALLKKEHQTLAVDSMLKVNSIGSNLAKLSYVQAMTDVTGFGLAGHLSEMCEASNTSAEIYFDEIAVLDEAVHTYISLGAVPGGTNRNFAAYGDKLSKMSDHQKAIMCDPQTSGGLLVAIHPNHTEDFEQFALAEGYRLSAIGEMNPSSDPLINII